MGIPDISTYREHISQKLKNEADPEELLMILKYFSVFRHPLKVEELYKLSSTDTSILSTKCALNKLISDGFIKQSNDFYLLNKDAEECIAKRLEGEMKCRQLIPKAERTGRFIAMFPFVKFVGISGSLSKNYADQNTDFDFFIITANNTLWICRSILHLIKKISFLFGKQHCLCMNYFIDEHHLSIEEKNLFVRVELSTLIPVYNKRLYKTFLLRNMGTLPNIRHLNIDFEDASGYNPLLKDKKNRFWKSLNILLMKLTDNKWKNKWDRRGYPKEDYGLAFKTTPYISKNHPKNYQKKLLQLI